MSLEIRSCTTADGKRLRVGRLAADGPPRARLIWLHGLAEYLGRYTETFEWFAERRFDCWMVEFRGHGESEGRRGHILRFDEYLDDLRALIAELPEDGAPAVAIGHSTGGLVLARALQRGVEPPAGWRASVLTSALLAWRDDLPAWQLRLATSLASPLPWLRIPSDIDTDWLTKQAEIRQAYAEDPLVFSGVTAAWLREIQTAMEQAHRDAAAIPSPLLMMHGSDDLLVPIAGAERFVETRSLAGATTDFVVWPGARHELFNETERDRVRGRVVDWLEGLASADRQR